MAAKSADLKSFEMGVSMSSLNCHQIKLALGDLFARSLLSLTSVRQHFCDSDLLSWSSVLTSVLMAVTAPGFLAEPLWGSRAMP